MFKHLLHFHKSMLTFYQLFLWHKSISEVTTFKIFTFSCLVTMFVLPCRCPLFCLSPGWRMERRKLSILQTVLKVCVLLLFVIYIFFTCMHFALDWTGCSTSSIMRTITFQCVLWKKFSTSTCPVVYKSWTCNKLFFKIIFWNMIAWIVWCLNLYERNYNMLNF